MINTFPSSTVLQSSNRSKINSAASSKPSRLYRSSAVLKSTSYKTLVSGSYEVQDSPLYMKIPLPQGLYTRSAQIESVYTRRNSQCLIVNHALMRKDRCLWAITWLQPIGIMGRMIVPSARMASLASVGRRSAIIVRYVTISRPLKKRTDINCNSPSRKTRVRLP